MTATKTIGLRLHNFFVRPMLSGPWTVPLDSCDDDMPTQPDIDVRAMCIDFGPAPTASDRDIDLFFDEDEVTEPVCFEPRDLA